MKVIGTNGSDVIVQLSCSEWYAMGGTHVASGYTRYPDLTKIPDIKQMAEALREIKNAQPDLERIRASFKTFLMLTESEAIAEVLKQCGVAEPVVEDDESVIDDLVEA